MGGSGPRRDAAEEACRERRGRGAGLRGPELRPAALCPRRGPRRGPGGPPVSGGRDVLSVPGGENQRPPGEDRRSRIRQRGPFHPSASRLPGSAQSSGARESGATPGSGVESWGILHVRNISHGRDSVYTTSLPLSSAYLVWLCAPMLGVHPWWHMFVLYMHIL